MYNGIHRHGWPGAVVCRTRRSVYNVLLTLTGGSSLAMEKEGGGMGSGE